MGLVDAFVAENTIEVKYSDFYKLIAADMENTFLKNALAAEIPREKILDIISGRNAELEEYRNTGLTPDQIRKMDKLYQEKCVEVTELNSRFDEIDGLYQKRCAEVEELYAKIDELKGKLDAAKTAILPVDGTATRRNGS